MNSWNAFKETNQQPHDDQAKRIGDSQPPRDQDDSEGDKEEDDQYSDY